MTADVTVVGYGIIALSVAAELAQRGVQIHLVGTSHQGEASPAAAGMLAPSAEGETGEALHFATASRDLYPDYLDALQAHTGVAVPLNRSGILQVAFTPEERDALYARRGGEVERLDATQVAALEPALRQTAGGVLHPSDGCVDSLALLDALRIYISRRREIAVHSENVRHIHVTGGGASVTTDRENRYHSRSVVLAAGAWSAGIGGVPRPVPVQPVRGQMAAFHGAVLRHVVYGGGDLVPKADGHTLAGSTMERVGFAAHTTERGIATVRGVARTLAPALETARLCATWAGLRPMTPDMLPLLGADPEAPGLIYACGHSRNGVLLAPLTAAVIADVATGNVPRYDLTRFRPDRF